MTDIRRETAERGVRNRVGNPHFARAGPAACQGVRRLWHGLAVHAVRRVLRRDDRLGVERVVRPQIWDLKTSTSQPGEDGSKPCSTSQRIAVRLRSDHQARITSTSTSTP